MMRWSLLVLFAALLSGCAGTSATDVVGVWTVQIEGSTWPEAEPEQQMAAQMMLSASRFDIREDGTFSLNLMASAKGTWKYDGEHLFLITEDKQFAKFAAASQTGEVQLDVFPDKGQLVWAIDSPAGKMNLVLVRAPAEEVSVTP